MVLSGLVSSKAYVVHWQPSALQKTITSIFIQPGAGSPKRALSGMNSCLPAAYCLRTISVTSLTLPPAPYPADKMVPGPVMGDDTGAARVGLGVVTGKFNSL